jgi:flavin-dependent dehydrogenase
MRVVVLGAGVAGCAAALAFAQQGQDVTVIDRDPGPSATDPDEVFDTWSSPGVAQHRQPHNFLGLGRGVVRDRFPALYGELLAAGSGTVDMTRFLGDAPREPGDEDLATIACRRPVFDAALRRAVDVRPAEATGLLTRSGQVTGVALADGSVPADLVVDAGGRASKVPDWLAAAGMAAPAPLQSDCGLLYYSRHYRIRDGEQMPPYASPLGGPRGDVGYLAYACFLGDNDTFSVCVMPAPSDKAFRDLREPAAFERVVRLLPGMAAWRDAAEPITVVLPMGHLRNTFRPAGDTPGLVAIGDARCHTNPTFALGASMGLAQGVLLAELAVKAGDVAELGALFGAEVDADLRARYETVSAEDRDRARVWGGEPLDVTDPAASMPLFIRAVVFRVAALDPAVLRAVGRRAHALDPIDQLESDPDLIRRARELYAGLRDTVPASPPRERLLAALTA